MRMGIKEEKVGLVRLEGAWIWIMVFAFVLLLRILYTGYIPR